MQVNKVVHVKIAERFNKRKIGLCVFRDYLYYYFGWPQMKRCMKPVN